MVIQKFGGTSVADPEAIRRLIEIARTARARDGRGPVLVVSAMSRVTDALLAVAAESGAGHVDLALQQIDQLRQRHLATACALTTGTDADGLTVHINQQFDELASVTRALAVLREVSPRTLDVVAAMGELLSSQIVAAALRHADLPGQWVDARRVIVTNDDHTRAVPMMRETAAALRASVLTLVESGRLPVLGGFVGATPSGHTTTLGRG